MEYPSSQDSDKEWTLIIKPQVSWFKLDLQEVWRYRDLVVMFVKRDFVAIYKQTILGPLWYLLQPALTTIMFILVFGKMAGIPTDGVPPAVFYLSGLVLWNFFSSCINNISVTFSANAGLFGKVYFPRLIVPIASTISALISFSIQFVLLLMVVAYFAIVQDYSIQISGALLLIPLVLLLVGTLGLGLGVIVSSLTAKYRDLTYLVSFGVQLLMYATPIIYPLSFLSGKYKPLILFNPLSSFVELFRYALLGVGEWNIWYIGYSVFFTAMTLLGGILIFNRVEKSFVDVI
ncbi:ABC transporter permease [Rufibacter radiotolerans]|uniref:Transport permease protein n=1 Tax=Rufibacter radiotolerans TaxID=1379910 RepID=A0A0H4W872_9BACT|nr:ABC transporter permease [Rufibacter radiotolerans]AKQ46636.1 ABC transporter permease [Rufibacter radiotolerans]